MWQEGLRLSVKMSWGTGDAQSLLVTGRPLSARPLTRLLWMSFESFTLLVYLFEYVLGSKA